MRTDSADGTHVFLDWLARRGRWLSYSVGMTITEQIHHAITRIPKRAWTPACNVELEIVQLALGLIAWMPMLALHGDARRWEIKKLRLRLFSAAARIIHTGRRHALSFAAHWPGRITCSPLTLDSHSSPTPG